MSKFQPGNPGRPVGSGRERAGSIIAKCNQYLAPYSGELIERAVEQALTGDKETLSAVLNIYAAALNGAAAELQAKLAKCKRQHVKTQSEATAS
jgi:hypothetical protein